MQEKSSAQQKKNKQNAAQKKKCGCCKWALGSIFIIALIAGALYYDTEVNGKGIFEKSATGKALKNAGVLPHVQRGWYVTMGASARGYKWAEQHVPPYAEPAIKTSLDVWKLARNAACNAYTNGLDYWRSKWPAVAKFVSIPSTVRSDIISNCFQIVFDWTFESYDQFTRLLTGLHYELC